MLSYPYRKSSLIRSMARSQWLRVAVAYTFVGGQLVLAAPQGEQVVHGQASFNRQGDLTQITASHNAVINYTGFDIHSHETVRFVQPSEVARVLNRIHSGSPTQIAGSLQANGRVYIVNPAGVIFANGAQIDVAGLYAAAAQMSNADFLNNVDRFTDVSGSVVNHGTIDAGFVVLVGQHVANYGSILADEGLVTMVAGDDVLLGRFDDHLMVKITGAAANLEAASQGVENSGQITAAKGKVKLGAGDMFSVLLHDTGHIKADQITVEGGQGSTVQVAGMLDASNLDREGGLVHVLGDRVAVDHAVIDASGRDGGGEVLIGGDYQGKGDVVNARRTSVGSDAIIHADAWGVGDGGKVIVWADELAAFRGSITARGGLLGGNGGLVETSGKLGLGVASGAIVNTSAPLGDDGRWLLDPTNARIVQTADAETMTLPVLFTDPNDPVPDDAEMDLKIDVAAINGTATGVVDVQANNDITVETSINIVTAGVGLNLTAGRSVEIEANITTNNGAVDITANDGDLVLGADVDAVGGEATLTASGSITGNGVVTASAVSLNAGATGTVGTDASKLNTNASTLAATGGQGVFINNMNPGGVTIGIGSAGVTANGGAVDIMASGLLTVDQTVQAGQSVNLAANDITFTPTGAVASTNTGVTMNATSGSLTVGNVMAMNATNGTVDLSAAVSLIVDQTIQAGQSVDLTGVLVRFNSGGMVDSTTGGVTVRAIGSNVQMADGSMIDAGDGRIVVDASSGHIALGRLVTMADDSGGSAVALTTASDGIIVDFGDTGGADVEATMGTLEVTQSSGVGTGAGGAIDTSVDKIDLNVTGGSTASALIENNGSVDLVNVNVEGDLDVTASGGYITDSGTVRVFGNAFFDADEVMLDTVAVDETIQLDTTGNASVTSAGDLRLAGMVGGMLTAESTASVLFVVDTLNVTGSAQLTATAAEVGIFAAVTANGMTITANDVELAGALMGNGGELLLQPVTNQQPIGLGAMTGGLDLSQSEISNITDFSLVTFGRMGGAHQVVVGFVTFGNPVKIQTTGTTNIHGDVFTEGTALTIDSAVTLGGGSYGEGDHDPLTIILDTSDMGDSLEGAGVTIRGTVDNYIGEVQPMGPFALQIIAGTQGHVRLEDRVGQPADALRSVSVEGLSMDLDDVTTVGSQTYVPLTTALLNGSNYQSMGSGDILFAGNASLNNDVTVSTANGFVAFQDAMNDNAGANNLTVGVTVNNTPPMMRGFYAGGPVTIGGALDVTSIGPSAGIEIAQSVTAGAVFLEAINAGSDVVVHDIHATMGDITLQSAPGLATIDGISNHPIGLITINSQLQTNGGDINLNTALGSTRVPAIASIIGNDSASGVTFITNGGDFNMGVNANGSVVHQKLTSMGGITINTLGDTGSGDVFLGDLSAVKDIDINAKGHVNVNLRNLANVWPAQTNDRGLDVISGGTLTIAAGGVLKATKGTGGLLDPVFADSHGVSAGLPKIEGLNPDVLSVDPRQLNVTANATNGATKVLDFSASVLGRLAESIPFADLPKESELIDVPDSQNLELSEIELLRIIGVPAVDPPGRDRVVFVMGESTWLINDITGPETELGEHEVTVDRVYTRAVPAALALYKTLYVGEEVDAEGKVITTSKSDRVRQVLTQAWIDYRTTGGDEVPMDFQRFLRSDPDSAEAWTYVVLLRSLFHHLAVMGLTERELDHARFVLLEREGIIPKGMSRADFERMILNEVSAEAGVAPEPGEVLDVDDIAASELVPVPVSGQKVSLQPNGPKQM